MHCFFFREHYGLSKYGLSKAIKAGIQGHFTKQNIYSFIIIKIGEGLKAC